MNESSVPGDPGNQGLSPLRAAEKKTNNMHAHTGEERERERGGAKQVRREVKKKKTETSHNPARVLAHDWPKRI